MLVEIKKDNKNYAKLNIDFKNEKMDVEYGPNRSIKSIDNIFIYPDGYDFSFKTVKAFLRGRGINEKSKTKLYKNIDDSIEITVLNQ